MNPAGDRDETFNSSNTDNVDLGNFLSRPARIYQLSWPVATAEYSTFATGIDPWVLWQNDPRVKSKISNYAYANFDLKLRLVLNGSKFQYGRLMCVYIPYGDTSLSGGIDAGTNQVFRELLKVFDTTSAGPSTRRQIFLQYISTYPHVILSPGSNSVADMTLPFIYHLNYINLNGFQSTDKQSLGKLFFVPLNNLRTAKKEADNPAKITVFAWAEKLNLVMPTELVPTSTPDSMKMPMGGGDEYPHPSAMASGVSAIANKLSKVPVIGKFAKATEIGAGAMSDVAKLFGFSTPVDNAPNTSVFLRNHGRMATSVGVDSSQKLTLDPKQEISIDPRVNGVKPHDEMCFSSIASREQYIGQTLWYTDGGQDSTNPKLLFSSLCRPSQINVAADVKDVSNRRYTISSNTPAGYLANCFAYWRGTITYRVEVVASPFHAGRIKLQFDPSVQSGGITTADLVADDVNARYTMILDLEQEHDIEFTIPYCNPRPFMRTPTDNTTTAFRPAHLGDTTQDVASHFDEYIDVGIFTITIVNDLVAPQDSLRVATQNKDTSPVYINVYFKMNDDLQFAQPEETAEWQNAYLGPFSSEIAPSLTTEETTMNASEEVQFSMYTPGDLNNVFFGEKIVSLRALCKRYSLAGISKFEGGPGNNLQLGTKNYPLYPPNTIHDKNDRRNTFCTFFMPMFLCVRGGQRLKTTAFTIHDNDVRILSIGYLQVERKSKPTVEAVNYKPEFAIATPDYIQTTLSRGYGGMAYTFCRYNPTLEFESPFYSNTRFYLGPSYYNVSNATDEPFLSNPTMEQKLYTEVQLISDDLDTSVLNSYYSAAEDFSLSFFLGVPPLWTYTIIV